MNAIIETEVRSRVALLQLNRPQALNALNAELVGELINLVVQFDEDPEIRAMIVTGSERAFAAGADISEMASLTAADFGAEVPFPSWEPFARLQTPLIAAVSGYALGGGCELAMMCDIILASESAMFGQPEITIGVLPGFGGSQRLPRAIGQAKAAEMILSGRSIDANEAERAGLVARVVPNDELMSAAWKLAEEIAAKSPLALAAAKQALRAAWELPLSEGLRLEGELFAASFDTRDQQEGMAAFLEKRAPDFRGE